jgi:hypothetical protein
MDGHIEEHAARDFDIGDWRRRRVAADDLQKPRRTNLTAFDGLADPGKIRVKAPVEANLELHPGLVDRFQRRINLGKVMIDGLLTKDVFAGAGGLDGEELVAGREPGRGGRPRV